jgi:hypothetical protein
MLIPKSSNVSLRISPGCIGGNLHVIVLLLAVVFGDFDVIRPILSPGKTDSILIVDPDAVLSRAVSLKGLQSIAGRDQKVGKDAGVIQGKQASLCHRCDVHEFFDGFPLEQTLSLFISERPDHISSL